MTHALGPLIRDLVEWIAREPRTYADVVEAWRTSCPRLTVWEDAIDRGLVERSNTGPGRVDIVITEAGMALLRRCAEHDERMLRPKAMPACAVQHTRQSNLMRDHRS